MQRRRWVYMTDGTHLPVCACCMCYQVGLAGRSEVQILRTGPRPPWTITRYRCTCRHGTRQYPICRGAPPQHRRISAHFPVQCIGLDSTGPTTGLCRCDSLLDSRKNLLVPRGLVYRRINSALEHSTRPDSRIALVGSSVCLRLRVDHISDIDHSL